jgi:Trk-type K+ transport system membrane component
VAIAVELAMRQGWNFFHGLQQAAFQVASVMTTTGFSTCDFDLWPQFSNTIMLVWMFIGACAGSTGGGMKVSRVLICAKAGIREARTLIRPRKISEMLPWDHIDPVVLRSFLEKEREKAVQEVTTPDCREGCTGCGMNRVTECFCNV